MKPLTVLVLSILGASPLAAQTVAESPEARATLAGFLSEHGEDYAQCFVAGPDLAAGATLPQAIEMDVPSAALARLVVAVDTSGSMGTEAGGTVKMDAARGAASAFLAQLPDAVSVDVVAFGDLGDNDEAGRAESCAGVETLAAGVGAAEADGALANLAPRGWTPLAAAIEAAGAALSDAEAGANAVYVVSDGRETCGGDPIAAARSLHASGKRAIVDVIGFDLDAQDRVELEAVAEAGGGVFREVETAEATARAAEIARARAGREAR